MDKVYTLEAVFHSGKKFTFGVFPSKEDAEETMNEVPGPHLNEVEYFHICGFELGVYNNHSRTEYVVYNTKDANNPCLIVQTV